MRTETLEEHSSGAERAAPLDPGVVVVFSGETPTCLPFGLTDRAIELGRDELDAASLPDGRVSRRHVRIEHAQGRWTVSDLGSRNGTFVDGRRLESPRHERAPVVRIGRTLMITVDDLRPFRAPLVCRDGMVMGPALQAIHERIRLIARSGTGLFIQGASGTGKELCARVFHAAGGEGARPFVAVNCATIQPELAERVLFGARRGAYTGAVADAGGLVQAADGGTLFLDEIAELNPAVQAKLLRVLETKEVTPLGAVTAVSVALRLCVATLKDLRAEVSAGRFREDLYFRIARPEARLPPLCDRREEIPWLVDLALSALPAGTTRRASAELVEACLLRPWPGNVRELLAETTTASVAAAMHGRESILPADLDPEAGRPMEADSDDAAEPEERASALPSRETIEEALRAEQGNVARAAARLGLARSRVRRFIAKQGIDLNALRSG